ncbi:MAG TPA: SRPBCC domain-containing protein [Candidatus Limnocylindria bacterium]|nr:SRPBCC domain-containing protein [Candidatus Limnocylindria bacterium]
MMSSTRIDRGSTDSTTVYSEGGDLTYERVFDAPRELIWRANTEAELIERWWGPRGHTTRVQEMDVRPGGKWRFVSTDESGNRFTFYGEYLEIVAPERIKWTFMFDVEGVGPQGGPETLTLLALDGGRTLMRAVSHMGSADVIEAALATGMAQGAIETWDRLEELLPELR